MNFQEIFNATKSFIDSYGTLATAIVLLAALWRISLWARGVVPLAVRAGNIRGNKIAIFAKSSNYTELTNTLSATRLYNSKNFSQIATVGDLDTADGKHVFVVSWEDWSADIDDILNIKTAKTGIVIYAKPGAIPPTTMEMLQKYNFVTVTNFRGRLMTDLLSVALTIRYAKK